MFLGLIPIVLGVLFLVGSFVAWERGYRSPGLHKLAVLAGSGLIWLGMVMACLALLTFATPAQAQPRICMPFAEIKAFLRDHHGERPIGGGQAGPGHAVHVFASHDGRSFTLLAVEAKTGMACALAIGTDWDPGALPGKGT